MIFHDTHRQNDLFVKYTNRVTFSHEHNAKTGVLNFCRLLSYINMLICENDKRIVVTIDNKEMDGP